MRRIGIFWDYENCRIPESSSGFTIAGNIRRAAERLGDEIAVFKGYLDIQLEAQSSSRLQSELQASGVSLIHCPHMNRKEVADRVLLVDFLVFGLESKEPVSIILITGDRDFSYALSALQMKGHNVYVIHPPWHAAFNGYRRIATGFLSWREVCNGENFTFTLPVKGLSIRYDPGNNYYNEQASRNSTARWKPISFREQPQRITDRNYRPETTLPAPQPALKSILSYATNDQKVGDQAKPANNRLALVDTSNNPGLPLKPPELPNDNPFFALFPRQRQIPDIKQDEPTKPSSENNTSPMDVEPAPSKTLRRSESTDSIEEISASAFFSSVLASKTTKRAIQEGNTASSSSSSAESSSKRVKHEGEFDTLIMIMKDERERGLPNVPCSILDSRLRAANPNIYLEKGVTDVRAYLKLAEKAHVVIFSDVMWNGFSGWVVLRNIQTVEEPGTVDSSNSTVDTTIGLMKKLKVTQGTGKRIDNDSLKCTVSHGKMYSTFVDAMREYRERGKMTLKKKDVMKIWTSDLKFTNARAGQKMKLKRFLRAARKDGIVILENEWRNTSVTLHPDFHGQE